MKRILFIYLSLLVSLFVSAQTAITQFSDQRDDQKARQDYATRTPNTPDDFLEGTIVIKVKEGIGPYAVQNSNISFGISSLNKKAQEFDVSKLEKRFKHKPITKNSGLPDLSRIYRIEFPDSYDVHQVAREFSKDPNIEYAEAVPIAHAADVPNDPMYSSQQHLPQIMASEAWDVHKGEDGEEVIIAIIDTGVDWLHPDLTENCWQNLGEDADGDGVTLEFNDGIWERDPDDLNGIDDDGNGFIDDVIGWDFYEQETFGDGSNPDPIWGGDLYEHGTHCAGIAAGRTNNGIGISSVSYNLKYMATQVDNGNDEFPHKWDAIIYAADNGADIISNSYGNTTYTEVGRETVEYAVGMGSIVVVAAHNFNTDTKFYPAAFPGSISISALNPDDTKASFTNYGAWLDIGAPGVSILSTLTNDNYAGWNGTSMATPMVAGLFGLLKSYQPDWTNEQLIEQIIGTADDIDALNPGYEKALGSGRINAYHALVDENVEVPQELRLEFLGVTFLEANGNGSFEVGETCNISISMRNYAHLVTDDNATFTLTSLDPDIEIITGTITAMIPADSEFNVESKFEFTVAEGAEPHIADFIIEVASDLPVIYGNEIEVTQFVAPSGFFVWDGYNDITGYSGKYIKEFLEERGYPVFYSNTYPEGFIGFDALFLSFGNSGSLSTRMDSIMANTLIDYLEDGGYVYLEGSDILGYHQINNTYLHELFGLAYALDGDEADTPIEMLNGQEDAITSGMQFTSSSQVSSKWVDIFEPSENGITAFVEEDYGIVGVQNSVADAHRTFCYSYAISYLNDVDPHSSRYKFMLNLMNFFGYSEGDNYLVANFTANQTEGKPDLEVQFTDWSIAENSETTGWAWDFDEDGIYDSYENNPVWTYTDGGVFDVQLVVSNEIKQDTLIKENFITVRSGILVFEGKQNENGYSGSFINNYLTDHFYDEVGYTNKFPTSLDGYDAIFLSFGNTGQRSTEITNSQESLLFNYSLSGGKIYIEGGDAMNSFDPLNLWVFGLMSATEGSKNDLEEMLGLEESIMTGLEFNSTNQLSLRSIDTYKISEDLEGAKEAFFESDYGHVAVEFDGSQVNGQKTFCMSYALADLEDGEGINFRDELLSRILNFFDVVADVNENELSNKNNLKVFPNPAKDQITLQYNAEKSGNVQVEIFDLSGRLVSSLNKNVSIGTQRFDFNISTFNPGVYYLRLQSGNRAETMKWIKAE